MPDNVYFFGGDGFFQRLLTTDEFLYTIKILHELCWNTRCIIANKMDGDTLTFYVQVLNGMNEVRYWFDSNATWGSREIRKGYTWLT